MAKQLLRQTRKPKFRALQNYYTYSVTFKVKCRVQFGQKLVVIGSIPELNNWEN